MANITGILDLKIDEEEGNTLVTLKTSSWFGLIDSQREAFMPKFYPYHDAFWGDTGMEMTHGEKRQLKHFVSKWRATNKEKKENA